MLILLLSGLLMQSLSDVVLDEEFIFRGVVNVPGIIDRHGKLSTGCLKQENGVSVDRDGGRSDGDVINFMISCRPPQRKPFFKFLKMNVKSVRSHEWNVKADPIEDSNPFHAEMSEVHPMKKIDRDNAMAIINEGCVIDAPDLA